jgi:CubicO group peptidase (beta-lactamase class C family)
MSNTAVPDDVQVAAPFRSIIDEAIGSGVFAGDDVQIAAYVGSEKVIDVAIGDSVHRDSLMIPFSVSKNSIAMSVGLLLERAQLDLDERVAHYWPEFGAAGKEMATVRQLLSHQVGLPQTDPALSLEELADDQAAAERLAAQRPIWFPGKAVGYHALTIGVLASELVRRITGHGLREFFETEIRAPRSLDFYLGLPEELESRTVELTREAQTLSAGELPFPRRRGQLGLHVMGGVSGSKESEEDRRLRGRRDRALGLPGAMATVSARGVAALFAEATVGVARPPFLSTETIDQLAQLQAAGTDLVIGVERRYAIVFQKPSPGLEFGGFRAFGHDGVGGALGFHDPETQISFGYTVRKMPSPGGADKRAIQIAQRLRDVVSCG